MLKDPIYHVLVENGFDEKEASIYMALVELGSASVLEISRKSKVNRASIYYILEKMKKQGLVSKIIKEKTDFFIPLNPDLLYAKNKSRLSDLKTILPQLKSLASSADNRPKVRFFEGVEGIKAVYEDSLTAKTDILNYANSEEIRRLWPEYDEEYVARRSAKKIWLRGLAPDDEYGKKVIYENKEYFRDIRLIDPSVLICENEINIYDNKIAMISLRGDIFGIIIESRPLADTQRSLFEIAWRADSIKGIICNS